MEKERRNTLSPCSLGRNLLAPLYPDLGYSQATRKARAESEPSNPLSWTRAETGRKRLLDTSINHPKGRGLLRARSRAAQGGEGRLPPGPGPLERSGLDLIRQTGSRGTLGGSEGSRQSAGKEAGSSPKSNFPPFGYSRALIRCVMTKRSMGMLGWRVQNSFYKSRCHWGSEAQTASTHTVIQEEQPGLQTLPKAIEANPLLVFIPAKNQGCGAPGCPAPTQAAWVTVTFLLILGTCLNPRCFFPLPPTFPSRITFLI